MDYGMSFIIFLAERARYMSLHTATILFQMQLKFNSRVKAIPFINFANTMYGTWVLPLHQISNH
jgi:hypothetical protein